MLLQDAKANLVDPSNTQVVGPGIRKAKTHEDNVFSIVAKNAYNDPVKAGGFNFDVKVTHPHSLPRVLMIFNR